MSEKSSTEDLSQIPMADDEVDSDDVLERSNVTQSSTPRSVPGNYKTSNSETKCSYLMLIFQILSNQISPFPLQCPLSTLITPRYLFFQKTLIKFHLVK